MFKPKEKSINVEKIHSLYRLTDQNNNSIFVEASKEKVSIRTFKNDDCFHFILSNKKRASDIAKLILKATELE